MTYDQDAFARGEGSETASAPPALVKNPKRVAAARKAAAASAERRREIHSAARSNLPDELHVAWDADGHKFMRDESARIAGMKDHINAASVLSQAFAETYGSGAETAFGNEGDRFHRRSELEASHAESWADEQEKLYYAQYQAALDEGRDEREARADLERQISALREETARSRAQHEQHAQAIARIEARHADDIRRLTEQIARVIEDQKRPQPVTRQEATVNKRNKIVATVNPIVLNDATRESVVIYVGALQELFADCKVLDPIRVLTDTDEFPRLRRKAGGDAPELDFMVGYLTAISEAVGVSVGVLWTHALTLIKPARRKRAA